MKHLKLTFLLTVLMSMVGATAFAHDIEVQNAQGKTIYYTWTNNNTELAVSYLGSSYYEYSNEYSGNVVIPGSVTYNGKEYSVTSIGNYAFDGCSGLTSITIPNSVTTIGKYAFFSCSSLTSVTIPNSVTSIGESAFGNCSGLTLIVVDSDNPVYDSRNHCNAIIKTASNTLIHGCENTTIPNSVTSIGDYAFSGCSGLTSITIPNSVTEIGSGTFQDCTSLNSITIPESVTSIGEGAFIFCSGLTSIQVADGNPIYDSRNNCNAIIKTASNTLIYGCKNATIPNSVTTIGDNAFRRCSGLTAVTIPNSVTSIGKWAFEDCSSLTSITIPNSVTTIGDNAFSGCSGLTNVTIGNSVKTIGMYAFYGCSGLTSVTIGNSVKTIGWYAFYGCSGLTAVTIPNSVERIYGYAFDGTAWYNKQPNGMVYAGKVAYKYKGTMPANTSIELEEGTSAIADYAFKGCSGLTSITIPNSVTTIGDYAFDGCSSLTSVTVMNPIPASIYSSTFSNQAKATLYVPAGSKAAYEAANYWRKFKEIVEIDPRTEQTLALSEIPTLTVGDAPYELPATTNEGLALNWSVGNNRIAVISEGKLIVKARGETTVTATQAGNEEYQPFTREFTLTVKGFDVTDISKLDNVIYMDETEVRTGGEATLSLKMKNTAPIRGFQFDLYLPNGLTVVKSSKGKIQGALCPDRLPDEDEHDLTFSEQPDGAIRFLCTDLYDETFTGNDGEIATLKVNVAADMTDGEYPIQLKNIKLTETDISKYYTSDLIESTVTIEGGATMGINSLTSDPSAKGEKSGNIYSLDGRKVSNSGLSKGIYIKNGKKVVIK